MRMMPPFDWIKVQNSTEIKNDTILIRLNISEKLFGKEVKIFND
jgi:hypothetical protein